MIKAPPTSHSSRENSRRSIHRKPLLLRSPKPTNKTGSRTVPPNGRRRPAPRLQSYGTCPILDNRRHPQLLQQSAGDVRGERHLLSPFSERRTGTRPLLKKAAKKRCGTREREEGTQTMNRGADTDETRKRTTWTKKKAPDTRGMY